MTQKILITSALPYANGPLHFGHIAGAYLPGDCYARFQRLKGNDVLFICGSDEYGIAITLSAEMAGRSPKEHVDIYHQMNKDFFAKLNISFDHYSRTTWNGHVETVQQFFNDLRKNHYVEERTTEQLYSSEDQKFLADRYVVGSCPSCGFEQARGDECPKCGASYEATDVKNPRSKITGAPLVLKPTKHWFLLLEKFRDQLLKWLDTKYWKPNVVNFVKNYAEGLRARSITRDSQWGVPLPINNSQGKVFYVWFDAPIGYISATKEWAQKIGSPDRWKHYWCDENTKLVQFVGKDNIPFHAVLFPAITMGQDQPYKLIDELPANEFYHLEGRQFSKSDGWYIDLEDFFKKYTTDQIRYTIAANAPETSDSDFTWKDFQNRCNIDLLGKFGNLINRTLVFAAKHCEGKIPEMHDLDERDQNFLKEICELIDQVSTSYEEFKVRRASQLVMEIAQKGNVYFDAKKPWSAAKDPEQRESMENTIACCLECLKALALVSFPIIAETAEKTWQLIGQKTRLVEQSWDSISKTNLLPGTVLPAPEILFRKIEDEEIEAEIQKLKSMSQPKKQESDFITIEDVHKLKLRVAKVLAAEPVAKSNKLLKLLVDIGTEKRTVVAGISQHYSPEEIVGSNVIIVANLKPAKLMGVESEGMLLAAKDGKLLEVVSVSSLPPGSEVS